MPTDAYPSAYPSLSSLSEGMKTASTTCNWDVVVSYSVKKLNAILKVLWTASTGVNSKGISATTENYDGKKIQWTFKLGPPTLSFMADKPARARLVMALSGTYKEDGETQKDIPTGYVLKAIVPLGSVKASDGDTDGTDRTPSSQSIEFNDTDSSSPKKYLHVVFEFSSDASEYSVDYVGSGTEPADFSTFAPKLQAWMGDSNNISAITYALASVSQDTVTVDDVMYLKPKSMAFSVYSSQSDPEVGCLSVYLRTDSTDDGNYDRNFTLPNNSSKESYPIPDGHSASIIISHNAFQDHFLKKHLADVKRKNTDAFKSITAVTSTAGFSFDLRLSDTIVAELNEVSLGQGVSTDKVEWKFSDSPLFFTIAASDSKASWKFDVTHEVGWMNNTGTGVNQWGTVDYRLEMDKSGVSILETNQKEVVTTVHVDSDYWEASWTAQPGNALTGKVGVVPAGVSDLLANLVYPTFQKKLRLDYFATTNVFAPKKNVIDIATSLGVFAPYDVLIVGDVVDPATFAEQ